MRYNLIYLIFTQKVVLMINLQICILFINLKILNLIKNFFNFEYIYINKYKIKNKNFIFFGKFIF